MSADDDRAAFEKWAGARGLILSHEFRRDGRVWYLLDDTRHRWAAWQAAIAAEREAAAKVCDKAAAESGAHLDALIAAGAPDAMVEKARAVYEAEDCLAAAIRARGAS